MNQQKSSYSKNHSKKVVNKVRENFIPAHNHNFTTRLVILQIQSVFTFLVQISTIAGPLRKASGREASWNLPLNRFWFRLWMLSKILWWWE